MNRNQAASTATLEMNPPSSSGAIGAQSFDADAIDESLVHTMGLTAAEIENRKQWLDFDERDIELLAELNGVAEGYAEEVIDSLYDHFLSFGDVKAFFERRETLERVKALQKQYFLRLTQGNYDQRYIENRLKIGAVHGRIGLDVKWYLGAYCFYMRAVGQKIFHAFPSNPAKALEIYFALKKLVFLDMGLAIDTYINAREKTIHQQQQAIRELSTPVLPLRPGLLLLPIIGAIDAQRAQQLTEQLLRSIRDNRARVVVIDITGVPSVDSSVANHLVQTVEASRLMGARIIVTGLMPDIAQTLVRIGVDLVKMQTVSDLQSGIEEAERIIGYRVTKAADN